MNNIKHLGQWLLLSIVATIFTNCSSSNNESWNTGNKNLDSILNRHQVHNINLDEVTVESVELSKSDILGTTSGSTQSDKQIFPAALAGLVVHDSSLFVADFVQNTILKMNAEGQWVATIGRKGKGPEEFSRLRNIYPGKKANFSYDSGNQSLNVYDENFRYIKSYNGVMHTSFSEVESVNDHVLLQQDDPSERTLITVYKTGSSLGKTENQLLPRLIPIGMQPYGYNIYLTASNIKGKLILAYANLPYIFIYDGTFEHVSTLKLESHTFTEIDNPTLTPVVGQKDQVFKLTNLLYSLFILEDGTILISSRSVLYVLKNTDGYYKVDKGLQFFYNNDHTDNKDQIIAVKELAEHNGTWFMTSKFEPFVFKYEWDD